MMLGCSPSKLLLPGASVCKKNESIDAVDAGITAGIRLSQNPE